MRRVAVSIGEVQVAGGNSILYTVGLGSCVAITVYDPERRIGGLAHALLPSPGAGNGAPPGRYASTAVAELLARVQAEGAARGRLRAHIAGGAAMFAALLPEGGRRLGPRNVRAARQALREAGVPLEGEDVGGTHGRSLFLDVADGSIRVTSVHHADVVF